MKASSDAKPMEIAPSKRPETFYRYLKPGALAKFRDSKRVQIRSRILHLPQTQIPLSQIASPSSPLEPIDYAQYQTDNIPCFVLRSSNRPRCLLTKKLIAVAPSFSET